MVRSKNTYELDIATLCCYSNAQEKDAFLSLYYRSTITFIIDSVRKHKEWLRIKTLNYGDKSVLDTVDIYKHDFPDRFIKLFNLDNLDEVRFIKYYRNDRAVYLTTDYKYDEKKTYVITSIKSPKFI